jgi:hypothetical protein
MRSDFFQEIAESRERFYRSTIGPRLKQEEYREKLCVTDSERNDADQIERPSENRRNLLIGLMTSIKGWLW